MKYQLVAGDVAVFGKDILISIQSRHAIRLYSGEKKFELRKVVPKVIPRRIFLYETNNSKKVSGYLVVEKVLSASPDRLWKEVGNLATTKSRFFEYFKGRSLAHAFEISRAVRYKREVNLDELGSIQSNFRVPQNFLYLDNLPFLSKYLCEKIIDEILPFSCEDLKLDLLGSKNKGMFLDLVERHISGSYLETSAQYANKLIEIHTQKSDYEGIATKNKLILEITIKNSLIGFVVVTEKGGGSVKTGPTILIDKYRGKGNGVKLRKALHELFSSIGYRKVYCTAPVNNIYALSYLIKSGYRIEAHLLRHYHDRHDELVFGLSLTNCRSTAFDFVRQITPLKSYTRLLKYDAEVVGFLQREFESIYCGMPTGWAEYQVKQSVACAKGRGSLFKPRIIFVAKDFGVEAIAMCLFKRGGALKIILLTNTAHQRSLVSFIVHIEKSILASKTRKVRKLYSHVPIGDLDSINSFYEAGFLSEGVLERPYNNHSDMLVFGKLLG